VCSSDLELRSSRSRSEGSSHSPKISQYVSCDLSESMASRTLFVPLYEARGPKWPTTKASVGRPRRRFATPSGTEESQSPLKLIWGMTTSSALQSESNLRLAS